MDNGNYKRNTKILEALFVACYFAFFIITPFTNDGSIAIMFGVIFTWLSLGTFWFFYALRHRNKQVSKINMRYLLDLGENLYGHYDQITDHFKTRLLLDDYGVEINQKEQMMMFERFIVAISNYDRRIFKDVESFRKKEYSDPLFFRYAHIYALYYLLENNIKDFVEVYGEFINNIEDRPEFRIFHEKLHVIKLRKDEYHIQIKLLESLYRFYAFQEPIETDLLVLENNSKLDDMILTLAMYYYSEAIEDKEYMKDLEEDFLRYKKIREKL